MKKHTIRNIIILYILFSLCISFTPMYRIPIVQAATYNYYYVSTINGSDADSGLTPALAWKTLDYAWETMIGPCTLYILAGTYDEKAYEWNDAHCSGNATNPTIVRNYLNDVVILKEGNDTTNSGVFQPQRVSWVQFRNLNFQDVAFHALYFESQAGFNMHNLTVSNCTFENISCAAIRFHGATEDIYDVLIENCDTNDTENAWSGITPSQETFSFSKVHSGIIRNNTMSFSAKNNIDLKSGSVNCEVYNNSINTTHTCGHRNDTYKELGGGIYIDGYSSTSNWHTVYNNTIWGNKTGMHLGAEQDGGSVANNTFYNNIVCINGTVDIDAFCFIFDEPGSGDSFINDTDVFHNTFYGGHSNVYFQNDDEDTLRTNFTNNIMDGSTNDCIRLKETNYIIDCYNNLYNGSSEYWGTAAINGSPVFINPGSNFRLQSSSPAINNGTNAGITIDSDGNTRPQGIGYDIGAYEYMYGVWESGTWNYIAVGRIDSSYVSATLHDVPILVLINSTVANRCQPNGEDIRFIAEDNITEYNYEIEFWNASGTSYVWVNITTVKANEDTYFNLYYSNSSASDGQDMDNTWHSNFSAVYHMDASTNTDQPDSSGNSHTLSKYGSPTSNLTGGKIGKSITFDGTNDYFNIDTHEDFNFSDGDFVVAAWINPTISSEKDTRTLVYKGGANNFGRLNCVGVRIATGYSHIELDDKSTSPLAITSKNISDANWHYYIGRRVNDEYGVGQDRLRLRIDYDTFTGTSMGDFGDINDANPFVLGADKDGNGKWIGDIDEVWIIKGGWNDSMVRMHFNNTNQTTGFLTFQSEIPLGNITIGTIYPANGATSIYPRPTLSMAITHDRGQQMNMTWSSNSSGSWVTFGHNLSVTNGTYYQENLNFSDMDSTFWWRVSINSGDEILTSASYYFSSPYHPENPTILDTVFWQYTLNITWTNGSRTDRVRVVRNNVSEPANYLDGVNGTNTTLHYFNDTDVHNKSYFKLYAWNSTYDTYSSGVLAVWGGMEISCYDELDLGDITFDVFITNQAGTQTYHHSNSINPHTIDISDLPLGDNILIQINASEFFRFYNASYFYMDLAANEWYVLNVYLTLENESELYLLSVIDELDRPIPDAKIYIQRWINESVGYENITILLTDGNGQVTAFLMPGTIYKVIITKSGYQTEYADYIPSSILFTHTFRLEFEEVTPTPPYVESEEITFNGYISGGILYVNYTDNLEETINTTIYIYEVNYTTNTTTLLTSDSKTSNNSYQISTTINTSHAHIVYLHYNHTTFGYIRHTLIFEAETTTITTVGFFENLANLNYGTNPFGWSNVFMWFFLLGCFFSFGQRGSGIGMILTGGLILFITNVVGFNTAFAAVAGNAIPILFIIIGIMVLWRNAKKEAYS